jgi:hypothetical protein
MKRTVRRGSNVFRCCGREHRDRGGRTTACALLFNRRQLVTASLVASSSDAPGLAEIDAASASGHCFLDITVDGEKAGRVVVALLDPSTIGAQRFRDLCKGAKGVGYKRSKFDALFPVSDLSGPCFCTVSCFGCITSRSCWYVCTPP